MVHVGAVAAPITISDVKAIARESGPCISEIGPLWAYPSVKCRHSTRLCETVWQLKRDIGPNCGNASRPGMPRLLQGSGKRPER